jgi:hypothetical protein
MRRPLPGAYRAAKVRRPIRSGRVAPGTKQKGEPDQHDAGQAHQV